VIIEDFHSVMSKNIHGMEESEAEHCPEFSGRALWISRGSPENPQIVFPPNRAD